MTGSPSKIHLITRSYLAGWARNGYLRPVHRRWGPQKPKTPAGVGWQKEWWGTNEPQLNAICEQVCNQLESQVPRLLKRLPAEWPPDPDLRSLFSQFVALHVVRTEGFADWLTIAREASLAKYRDDFTPEQYAAFCAQMRTPHQRAERCFGMINKMSSVLGSMHWTLMTFDEPLLVTSDQPVAAVPLMGDGQEIPIKASPDTGWLETVEFRFPITPQLALLGSWHLPTTNAPVVEGRWSDAVNLNAVTVAQSKQWTYALTDRVPAMPALILREPVTGIMPITPQILPGYTMQSAQSSQVRCAVSVEINRLIETSDDRNMVIIVAQAA